MAVDASIYGAIRAPQAPNQLEQFAQIQQIQGAQNQNRLADLMFGEKQRESDGQTALANAYKAATDPNTGAIDRNKLYGALAQGGQGAKLPTVQKGFADQDKAAADANKSKLEAGIQELGAMGQLLSGVKDQASWEAARAQAARMFGPEKVNASMPAQYDPVLVAQKRDQALSVADQLVQKWKAMEYTTPKADAVLQAKTSRDNNAASNATTQRGQNMTDARTRESTAATLTKPFEVTGEDGKPLLVQQDKQGNIRPVTGYLPKQGAGSAGTEGERNAAGYADRMVAAEKLIGAAALKDPKAQKPGVVEQTMGGVGMAANVSRSPVRQEYRQAQEDWVRSKLRKESGAAIPNDEMEREITVYFPQIGDKPGVIAQKVAARKVAESAMKQAAGRAYKEKGGATPNDAPEAVVIKDKSAFDALPSGATFTAPDGSIRRKP